MKIQRISLTNYRAFDCISLPLSTGMNVFYGINGVGKSSIVHAIHDMLLAINAKQGWATSSAIFPDSYIRDKNKECKIEIVFNHDGSEQKLIATRSPKDFHTSPIPTDIPQPVYLQPILTGNPVHDGTTLSGDLEFFQKRTIPVISFIPGFTPTKINTLVDQQGSMAFQVDPGPRYAVAKGISYIDQFKMWFEIAEGNRLQQFYENKNKKSFTGSNRYSSRTIDTIIETIHKIYPSIDGLKIDRSSPAKNILAKKNDDYLDVSTQLSDGEASLIFIIGIICSHQENAIGGNTPILLFDEIENSFHPKWQSTITKSLKSSFPNYQFILTSHSPFVLSELDKEDVIILEKNAEGKIIAENIKYAKGGNIDDLITEFFSVDMISDDVREDVQRIENLIRSEKKPEALDAISKMRERYGELPIFVRFEMKMKVLGL